MIKNETLITINERGDIRVIELSLNYSLTGYAIDRKTYQYGCKVTTHPTISGRVGFNGRDILKHAEFVFNTIINKYCDKGYKKLSSLTRKKISSLTENEMVELYGPTKVFSDGMPKLMKAMDYNKCSNSSLERNNLCTAIKYGEHCLLYKKDNKYYKRDDSGKDNLIMVNDHLKNLFSENNIILDVIINNNNILIIDYISDEHFDKRVLKLSEFKNKYLEKCEDVSVVEYEMISGWYYINKKFKKIIADGYEALLLKNPNKKYAIGQRSSLYMIKISNIDNEFF